MSLTNAEKQNLHKHIQSLVWPSLHMPFITMDLQQTSQERRGSIDLEGIVKGSYPMVSTCFWIYGM